MGFLRPATSNSFGLIPFGTNARIAYYAKDAAAAYIPAGEPVVMSSDGGVDPITAGTESNVLGVAAAAVASGSAGTVAVYDDPNQIFVVADDGVAQLAQTNIGNHAALVVISPHANGQSKTKMSTTTVANSTTLAMVKILQLHPIETSYPASTGDPRKWLVMINPGVHFHATVSGV